ncbi:MULTISPECIES: ribosome maturation factor RimP [unclassified Acinetobacter]|uniref:ribosome maturation factor RimP n=1 Tax=unclassified Acinetobacter TaxID=196816 RepID=UPI0035B8F0F3
MKLSSKTQALHDLIAPAVAVCNVDLWGVEFIPQGKKSLLRIYIDKPESQDNAAEPVLNEDGEVEQGRGIGVQDCVSVTHQVNGVLDVHDPIAGEYALEVSSPGWDRPFFYLAQMQSYVGQTVALRLIHAVANRRKAQGKLLSVDVEKELIVVEIDGQSLEIDSHNIDKANLIYQD